MCRVYSHLGHVKESILHITLEQLFALKQISQGLKISYNQQIELLTDVDNSTGFCVCHYCLECKHVEMQQIRA